MLTVNYMTLHLPLNVTLPLRSNLNYRFTLPQLKRSWERGSKVS